MAWKSTVAKVPLIRQAVIPKPTPADVRDFWEYMTSRYGTRVIDKRNNIEMRALGELLDLFGVLSKKDFLEKFTTVLPMKNVNVIYTPFEIGVPSKDWSLWQQTRVCVHEINHVLQCREDGDLGFTWGYVTSAAQRAHYEIGGYRCDMEIEYRYMGKVLDPYMQAIKLLSYGCTMAHVEIAHKQLALSIPIIKRGAIIEPSSRAAVKWLDRRFRWVA